MSADQAMTITAFVDIEAPPPRACRLLTSSSAPTSSSLRGLPLSAIIAVLRRSIIVTGGVNRHSGIVEGQEFRRFLTARGVPDEAIRVEDKSASTWQNVEFALPSLSEALESGLSANRYQQVVSPPGGPFPENPCVGYRVVLCHHVGARL